ncbi:hypothetical protein GMA8713_03975 [Grimontia marina]|uniref:Uncharacterized protein n=1 Tax=Grimontia marina TaxID=646534 RepID=A0A128FGL4_9GAMM|nr:hypothetical protein GMA8713_03975 [Grimontia marina]
MGEALLAIVAFLFILGVPVFMGFLDEIKLKHKRVDLENYDLFKFRAAGKNVVCSHCNSEYFRHTNFLLNTRAASFLGLDWANKSTTSLECMDCGKLTLFAQEKVVKLHDIS